MRKAALSLFFLLSTLYFLLSATNVLAQTNLNESTSQTTNVVNSNTNPDVENNPHNSTQATIIEIMSAITCQLTGIDPINPKQSCLGIDQTTGKIGFIPSSSLAGSGQVSGGAIGVMGNMITMLYTPPVRTSDYFQNLAQNFGITKTTYAQEAKTGTGFEGLRPLLGLWTTFRNIVYLIFVIIFVIIGMAIMLRIKIDPRTVMTIQNQIPKIIIGILLVTFSYAIAGFLIDLMYVTIHITGNVIASSGTKINPSTTNNITTASNPFRAIGALMDENSIVSLPNLAWKPAEAVSEPIAKLFENPPGRIITGILGYVLGTQARKIAVESKKAVAGLAKGLVTFLGITAAPVTGGASVGAIPFAFKAIDQISGAVVAGAGFFFAKNIAQFVISTIIFLVILIALLVALFRLWITLLMAYVYILLDVVLAPFWIIGGIIPGSPISVSGWLRDISANLLAFPVTIAMFLLGKVFMDAFTNKDSNNFIPPLIGNRLEPEALGAVIGLSIIFMTPNVVNMLKTALKAPKVDTGLGKALGPGLAVPGRTVGGITGLAFGSAIERGFSESKDPNTQRSTLGKFLRGFGFIR